MGGRGTELALAVPTNFKGVVGTVCCLFCEADLPITTSLCHVRHFSLCGCCTFATAWEGRRGGEGRVVAGNGTVR